jgi:serine/threonine protein phosphatase PrpC
MGSLNRGHPVTRPLQIEAAGQTHAGRVRDGNEDSFAVLSHHNLFMVADGMGGHSYGEVASMMAINTVEDFFDDPDLVPLATAEEARARLVAGVKLANRRILRAGRVDRSKRGMGTTFAGVLVQGSSLCIAHVGDSRVYRFRGGKLEQLTEDHSALREVRERGGITSSAAEFRSLRHVLTRALGLWEGVEVDARIEDVKPNDLVLLCSDGLAGVVDEEEIVGILEAEAPLDTTAWALIERANEYGGPDNVTCVLVRWMP